MPATLTNEQRSAAEVAAFKADPPGPYFAYQFQLSPLPGTTPGLRRGSVIGTWMGDELARVTWAGDPFYSAFGDRRQNFRAKAINGATYSGTAYLSAGDYVRMRPVKGDSSARRAGASDAPTVDLRTGDGWGDPIRGAGIPD